VVEQQNFVECGSSQIADSQLQFFVSISEAIQTRGTPDILVISCTLQYLKDPYTFLQQVSEFKIPFLLIDSTPFNYARRDRITVQRVNPAIYDASYPCWFLNYERVKEAVGKQYTIKEEYQNELYIYLDGHKIQYRGILAELNN
jgi:putative methyltransferase (TIGR04325 family)